MADDVHLAPGENIQVYAPTGQKLSVGLNSKSNTTRVRVTASGTYVPPVTPPPVTPPPSGTVDAPFTGGTQAQFLSLVGNMNIDRIVMGTSGATLSITGWGPLDYTVDRSARPLDIVRAPNAIVNWDGTGFSASGNNGPFRFGLFGNGGAMKIAKSIRMRGLGSDGLRFGLQNYLLGQTALIVGFWSEDCEASGFEIKNYKGTGSNSTTHVVYLSSDGTHRSARFTTDDMVCHLTDGAHIINGLQTYHMPNCDGVTAKNWDVSGLHVGAYLWADATGIDVDGWKFSDVQKPVSAPLQSDAKAQGIVKNCVATACGANDFSNPNVINDPSNVW